MNPFAKHIANALSISEHQVEATLKLLDEGCTIPFIARYRKERTGNLDEVQITRISELNAQLKELEKRKATILKTIAEQYPNCDVDCLLGGQPLYYYLISVE